MKQGITCIIYTLMSLVSPKITPPSLHLAVVAVLDEFLQGLLGVFGTVGVLIVLDSVYLDAAVVLGTGAVETPGLGIGLNGVDYPVFIDKQLGVEVWGYGKAGGCHLTGLDEASASDQVLLAPVATLAARGEVLDGLAVINALLGAVNPAKAQRHLYGIHVPHYARAVSFRPVYAQPEITHLIVIILVPLVQFLAGVYVKQVGYFHYLIIHLSGTFSVKGE